MYVFFNLIITVAFFLILKICNKKCCKNFFFLKLQQFLLQFFFLQKFATKNNGTILDCVRIVITKAKPMRKESELRKMVGLTQKEMAQILNVSRGRYAMFESGKRDLPLESKQLLSDILAHLQAAKNSDKFKLSDKELREAEEQAVKELLLENDRKRYLLDKKIAAATRKQDAAIQKIQTLNYLKYSKEKSARFDEKKHDAELSKAHLIDEQTSGSLRAFKIYMEILNASREFLQSQF